MRVHPLGFFLCLLQQISKTDVSTFSVVENFSVILVAFSGFICLDVMIRPQFHLICL